MSGPRRTSRRRQRLLRRALPIAALALIAFTWGLAVGSRPAPSTVAATEYASAWAREDYDAMHQLRTEESQAAISPDGLAAAYEEARRVATVRTIATDEAEDGRDEGTAVVVPIPLTVVTVAFGTIEAPLELVYDDNGIAWEERLVFPGLRQGESLRSEIELPERASIMSLDQVPLAEGPALSRTSPIGSAAYDVTGYVGEPDAEQQEQLLSLGLPPDTPVGVSGLEQAFNTELTGQPGGELIADDGQGGQRRLAASEPLQGDPLLTTIVSDLQLAAVGALAGRSGGIVALDARNGAVRAMAGQAYSAPQPPGSTYKVLTTVAALEKDLISFEDEFPYVTGINVGGRFINNAHSESCGGTFPQTFARSCNSVFLPLGPELGSDGLVEIAERFGFNSPPQLFNERATASIDPPASTIPTEITNEEELAVSAIGQGKVLATPLQMASVAQTVANRGVRSPTAIVRDPELRPNAKPVRVMTRATARQLNQLMVGVVTEGTGYAGAISAAQVAGKTGTAELGPKPGQTDLGPDEIPEQMVDAWFIAFAPAERPSLAVAVMLIDADADGGTVAAPAAAEVLAAGVSG